jgi:hypothetical protein
MTSCRNDRGEKSFQEEIPLQKQRGREFRRRKRRLIGGVINLW